VEEETGHLRSMCGSAYKTSACIVDALAARWDALEAPEKAAVELRQITMDNGSESHGVRTPFLHRMVQCAAHIAKPSQRLYYPPSHRKYNPIERCWGILELPWKGTKLLDVETMLEWAKRRTWKGMQPVVELRHQVYQKGISLGKRAMRAIEKRLERHPPLPKSLSQ
jgi:hypothetical protein